MKICVVNASHTDNPQLNDCYMDFRDYSTYEDARWRSWASLPACMKTEFFAYGGENFHEVYKYDGVILLFNNHPHKLIPFVKKLKMMGKKVCVGYHEGFDDFMLRANSSWDFSWLKLVKQLVDCADAYWNVIPSANDVFKSLFEKPVFGVLHAVPFKEWNHSITKPIEERNGILLATRSFNQRIRRNTLAALAVANLAAKKLDTHVTFVSESGQIPPEQLDRVKTIIGSFPYVDWLDLISKHKLVVHFDESHTLGQIVSDAALVDVMCIGGNSENNRYLDTSNPLVLLESDIIGHYPSSYPLLLEYSPLKYFKHQVGFESIAKQVQERFELI